MEVVRMIPKRTLTATIEISTGKITITSVPPSYTGETNACDVVINLYNGGSAYSPSGVTAGMYLYWPGQQQMTAETPLMISGSQLTGSMPAVMMARAGNPLLVVQLQDDGVRHAVEDHIHAAEQLVIPEDKGLLPLGDALQRFQHRPAGADKQNIPFHSITACLYVVVRVFDFAPLAYNMTPIRSRV